MRLNLKYFALLFVITFAQVAQAQIADKDLPNFHQVNENLYRGAQPSQAGIVQLKQIGVKTIISLRGADENSEIEGNWAQSSGIKFINIPLNNWFGPKDEKIEKILASINNAENQPVFVHCKRGADRTGTVIAVYRITHDGWTAKRANVEAKERGFGWWQVWMKDFIKDYYRDFKKQS